MIDRLVQLADALSGTKPDTAVAPDRWPCEAVNALAGLLASGGHHNLAAQMIFWHSDERSSHHGDDVHAQIWAQQRDGYTNPEAWKLARNRAEELGSA